MKFPVWNVLAVWEGGMASHGGIAGEMIAAAWIYPSRHEVRLAAFR